MGPQKTILINGVFITKINGVNGVIALFIGVITPFITIVGAPLVRVSLFLMASWNKKYLLEVFAGVSEPGSSSLKNVIYRHLAD